MEPNICRLGEEDLAEPEAFDENLTGRIEAIGVFSCLMFMRLIYSLLCMPWASSRQPNEASALACELN